MKKIIRWTAEERQVVAQTAARFLKDQGIAAMPSSNDRVGGAMVISAINKSQDALPKDRLRQVYTRQLAGADLINRIARELNTIAVIHRVETIKAEAEAELAQQDAKIESPPPPPPPPFHSLIGFTDAELLQEMSCRYANLKTTLDAVLAMQELQIEEMSKVRKELDERLLVIEQKFVREVPAQTVDEQKVPVPVVAILGCRKYEFDHIATHVATGTKGLGFILRHYDQDRAPCKIHADYAISFKWLSHAWDAQIKGAVPAARYKFINGGVGTAVQQLKTWFS